MTYRELRELLHDLTEEQLDYDITVEALESDEFIPGEFRVISWSEVLGEDHPVITVDW